MQPMLRRLRGRKPKLREVASVENGLAFDCGGGGQPTFLLKEYQERARTHLAAVSGQHETHPRNLLVLDKEIVMVDFQDSLVAPGYYDLVSLAFDSYLDLGMARGRLFPNLAACGHDRELQQVRLTALQRNIKALGTFAYQTHERRHPAYARYIPRTLHHIRGHLQVLGDPELEVLNKYFNALNKY